jgi:transcriptional regulator with XRE-family HTH domain
MTLREWLAISEYSGAEVAKKIGVSATSLSRWRTGGRAPSLKFALKLRDLSGGLVTLVDLNQNPCPFCGVKSPPINSLNKTGGELKSPTKDL